MSSRTKNNWTKYFASPLSILTALETCGRMSGTRCWRASTKNFRYVIRGRPNNLPWRWCCRRRAHQYTGWLCQYIWIAGDLTAFVRWVHATQQLCGFWRMFTLFWQQASRYYYLVLNRATNLWSWSWFSNGAEFRVSAQNTHSHAHNCGKLYFNCNLMFVVRRSFRFIFMPQDASCYEMWHVWAWNFTDKAVHFVCPLDGVKFCAPMQFAWLRCGRCRYIYYTFLYLIYVFFILQFYATNNHADDECRRIDVASMPYSGWLSRLWSILCAKQKIFCVYFVIRICVYLYLFYFNNNNINIMHYLNRICDVNLSSTTQRRTNIHRGTQTHTTSTPAPFNMRWGGLTELHVYDRMRRVFVGILPVISVRTPHSQMCSMRIHSVQNYRCALLYRWLYIVYIRWRLCINSVDILSGLFNEERTQRIRTYSKIIKMR